MFSNIDTAPQELIMYMKFLCLIFCDELKRYLHGLLWFSEDFGSSYFSGCTTLLKICGYRMCFQHGINIQIQNSWWSMYSDELEVCAKQ